MTKKDYQLVASVFKDYFLNGDVDNYDAEGGIEFSTVQMVAEDMCNALKTDNPLFDRSKFLKACGFPKEEL